MIGVEWQPFPRIGLKFDFYPGSMPKKWPDELIGNMRLITLEDSNINLNLYMNYFNSHHEDGVRHMKLYGDLTRPATILTNLVYCNEVRFHLINFVTYGRGYIREDNIVRSGRIKFKSEKYDIIIDSVPNVQKLTEQMERFSGYAITHAGLATCRGGNMKYEEAEDLLDALYYFFAFLSGCWCGPVLSVGLLDSKKSWENWDVVTNEWYANVTKPNITNRSVPISGVRDKVRLTPWQSRWMWIESANNNDFNQIFQGFMVKWEDPSWKDSIKTAIYLYVEANQAAGGTEGAIVLTQSALELLASMRSSNRLKNADMRIRSFLKDLDIPVDLEDEVHPYLNELRNYCEHTLKSEPSKDGPKVITLLRNAMIHPDKNKVIKLSKTDDKVKLQILELGIWYLEMVLLRLFGYTGQYANRLWRFRDKRNGSGFNQKVPWNGPILGSHCDNCPMPLPKNKKIE